MLFWILGHLTPCTSLGLNSFSCYTSLVHEWYQQSNSTLIWVYMRPRAWPPALRGSSTIKEHYGPCNHKHRCVKSAKLNCESGCSGLQPLSPRVWHIRWCRDALGGSRELCLGCVSTPVKILPSAERPTWKQRGWDTAGRKHVLHGFGVKPRFTFQRRNMDFHRPFIKPSWTCADRIK